MAYHNKLCRLPKVWTIARELDHNSSFNVSQYVLDAARHLNQNLIPGDIIDPLYDGCEGVMIVERNGSVDYIMQNGDYEGFIPPWVPELYMKKGYSLNGKVIRFAKVVVGS